MTREIRSDSAFCDTLNLHNVQNKQFHIRRSKFCQRYCLVDVKMFVVSFTFATQQSTNKMPKQNNLLLGSLALWGVNYMPFCSLLCFHLAEKVKLIANPVPMNSELTKKKLLDENNYKPIKSQRHPCLQVVAKSLPST